MLDPSAPHPRDPQGRTPEQIDDAIDAWHAANDGTPLHVALGWTWEEYVRWASPPRPLDEITRRSCAG